MRDPNRVVSSVIHTDGCNNTDDEIELLEHIQATIKYSYSLRGACQFYLISPSGTKSQLLSRRGLDLQSNGQQVKIKIKSLLICTDLIFQNDHVYY